MLGGLAVFPQAHAQTPAPLDTSGATKCTFIRGFAIDRDPKGSNLRSAPRADAPIIGHVAPLMNIGSDTWTGVTFDIVGSKDGWLLVKRGETDPPDQFTLDKAHAEDGRGWISARLVSTALSTSPLRAGPARTARLVATMKGDNWGPDSADVRMVHGCSGKYIEVTAVPMDGKPVRGWSYEPCASQLTTCSSPDIED